MKHITTILATAVSRYWGIALVFIVWQGWVTITGFNSIVLPHPIGVFADLITNPQIYFSAGGKTLLLAAIGLVLGMAIGTLIAVATWSSVILNGVLVPVCVMFASVPVVSMIPVIARIVGYDIHTELVIVVVISFFPAFIFTSAGFRALPAGSEDLFRVLGADGWTRFTRLVLPAAVPNWMIALRLAAPPAVLAAMIAEFLMGTSGLGYLFRAAEEELNTERALGASVIATVVSVVTFMLALSAERFVAKRWQ